MEKDNDDNMSKFTEQQLGTIDRIIKDAAKFGGDEEMVMRWRDIRNGRVFDAAEINGWGGN
jgi:hypothetical protein